MACEFDDKSKCCVTSDVKMCVLGEKIFEMQFFQQKTWKSDTTSHIPDYSGICPAFLATHSYPCLNVSSA
jgi:hypothetical protein